MNLFIALPWGDIFFLICVFAIPAGIIKSREPTRVKSSAVRRAIREQYRKVGL